MSNMLSDMWLDLILELKAMNQDDLLSPREVRELMAKIESENA